MKAKKKRKWGYRRKVGEESGGRDREKEKEEEERSK